MTTHCDLCVAQTGNGFVVRVQGRGTSTHSPALASFVRGCFDQDPNACVVVDLLGCDYLDSTFLGCLLNLQRAGTETRFQVVANDTTRKKLLAATQLDAFLTLVTAAPKSVSSFLRIDANPLSPHELGQHMMEAHQALADVPSDSASAFRQTPCQCWRERRWQDRVAEYVQTGG